MNQEDKDFLKELQHEMITQETVCQANPRFWVVMQTARDYWVDDDIDGIGIYDQDTAESVFEGELKQLADWIKEEFDVVQECEGRGDCMKLIKYYLKCIKWLWKHKNDRNCRQKFRRMDREISAQ